MMLEGKSPCVELEYKYNSQKDRKQKEIKEIGLHTGRHEEETNRKFTT